MFGRSIFSLAVFTLGTIGIDAQQTPPEGSTNIGTVGFDGAFTDNGNGNWLVTGSGSDIWVSQLFGWYYYLSDFLLAQAHPLSSFSATHPANIPHVVSPGLL